MYIQNGCNRGLDFFFSPFSCIFTFSLPSLLQLVSLLFFEAFMSPSLKPSVASSRITTGNQQEPKLKAL